MTLFDPTTRGILEQIIDKCIEAIPELMPEYRNEDVRGAWLYDKAEDFVLGLTIGMIFAYFEGGFFSGHHRQLTVQERSEGMSIVTLRMPQIREALFKAR